MTGAASSADAHPLTNQIVRLRDRWRLAVFIHHAPGACACAILAIESLLFAYPALLARSVALVVAAVAAGVLAAVAIAFRQTRDLRAAARHIDRRLGLQDRLVTAFQYRGASDPFSQLVVRDARSRVGAVHPSATFPLQVSRLGILTMALAMGVPIAYLTVTAGLDRLGDIVTRGGSAGGTQVLTSSERPASQSPDATAASPIQDGAMAAQKASADSGLTQPQNESPTTSTSASASGDASAKSPGAPSPLSDMSSQTTVRRSGQADARGGSSGASGTGTAASAPSALSGGIGAGLPPRAQARRTPDPAVADRRYATEYSSARGQAEQAISQDRVPFEWRSHVRRYFAAIRPRESQ